MWMSTMNNNIVHCWQMAAKVIVDMDPLPQFQSRPGQLWWWWSCCFWFWFCKPANQARLVQCLVCVGLKRFLGDGTVNVKLVLNTQDTTNNSHTQCIVLYYRFTIPTSLNVRLSSSSLSPSWPYSSSSSSSLLRSSQCDLLGGRFCRKMSSFLLIFIFLSKSYFAICAPWHLGNSLTLGLGQLRPTPPSPEIGLDLSRDGDANVLHQQMTVIVTSWTISILSIMNLNMTLALFGCKAEATSDAMPKIRHCLPNSLLVLKITSMNILYLI